MTESTITQLDNLLTWLPTNPQAVAHAKAWITELYQCVQEEWQMEWIEPNITADCDGNVAFEWRRKPNEPVIGAIIIERWLAVYLGPSDDDVTIIQEDTTKIVTGVVEKGQEVSNCPSIKNDFWRIWKRFIGN